MEIDGKTWKPLEKLVENQANFLDFFCKSYYNLMKV